MEYALEAYRKYATFEGRARRKEFWWFVGLVWATIVGLELLVILGEAAHIPILHYGSVLLAVVFIFGSIVPSLALRVRRLHDIGKSGFWLFLAVIPLLGEIVLLIFALLPGASGSNRYGEDPRSPAMHVETPLIFS